MLLIEIVRGVSSNRCLKAEWQTSRACLEVSDGAALDMAKCRPSVSRPPLSRPTNIERRRHGAVRNPVSQMFVGAPSKRL